MKLQNLIHILIVLVCFGLLSRAQAVSPPPDGCYPGFTTAEGCNALQFLGAGAGNTGVGWYSLYLVGDANYNTGVGAGTLVLNTADDNTAVGAAALLLNTSGHDNVAVGTDALVHNDSGNFNNAVGAFALFNNIDGDNNNAFGDSALAFNVHGNDNTAIGDSALENNDMTGNGVAIQNTAVGAGALLSNTDGHSNTAVGSQALFSNTDGASNTAVGDSALSNNIDGFQNTAFGYAALFNSTGFNNTGIGASALGANTSGIGNTAVGFNAGAALTTESGNLDIDNPGVAGESNAIHIGNASHAKTFIAGIYNQPYGAADMAVRIGSDGKLGTVVSSRRFKHDIKPLDKGSEVILALKPVTFHYKSDAKNTPSFGLIAEEVAEVSADLVIRDKEGKPLSVRYEDVNVMLLNEFLKEHGRNAQQEATIAELKSTVAKQEEAIVGQRKDFEKAVAKLKEGMETVVARFKEHDAKIQNVSEKIELNNPTAQIVSNDQ